MADLDLSKLFDGFGSDAAQSNPIKTIYDIIPTYDPVQQKMLFQLEYFINKWHLDGLKGMVDRFSLLMADNKNLSFFGSKSLRDMLSAYTQSEMMGRISIHASNKDDE